MHLCDDLTMDGEFHTEDLCGATSVAIIEVVRPVGAQRRCARRSRSVKSAWQGAARSADLAPRS